MVSDPEYPEYEQDSLDFSHHSLVRRCPYCGESLSDDELDNSLEPESNTLTCPNCRKRLNVHELGGSI